MNSARELPFVMSVLDDGLWLYRRHLAHFTSIAAVFVVPLGILSLGTLSFVRTQVSMDDDWTAITAAGLMLISYPFVLYMFGALSKAAAAALDGQAIALRPALRIAPLGGCGMIVFSTVFTLWSAFWSTRTGTMRSHPCLSAPLSSSRVSAYWSFCCRRWRSG